MIDVWLFELDLPDRDLAALEATLDAAERARAGRFRFGEHRRRFIVRRGALRRLLGGYLKCPPAEIRFAVNAYGKPLVDGGGGLEFSTSHSAALGMCVVADGVALGCDLERRDPRLADPATAERLFAPGERRALRALSGEAWIDGFFNCWTRKEAYVKALGLGLSCPLDSFEVSLSPGAPADLIEPRTGWSLRIPVVAAGYHAAVVARGDSAKSLAEPRWLQGLSPKQNDSSRPGSPRV